MDRKSNGNLWFDASRNTHTASGIANTAKTWPRRYNALSLVVMVGKTLRSSRGNNIETKIVEGPPMKTITAPPNMACPNPSIHPRLKNVIFKVATINGTNTSSAAMSPLWIRSERAIFLVVIVFISSPASAGPFHGWCLSRMDWGGKLIADGPLTPPPVAMNALKQMSAGCRSRSLPNRA